MKEKKNIALARANYFHSLRSRSTHTCCDVRRLTRPSLPLVSLGSVLAPHLLVAVLRLADRVLRLRQPRPQGLVVGLLTQPRQIRFHRLSPLPQPRQRGALTPVAFPPLCSGTSWNLKAQILKPGDDFFLWYIGSRWKNVCYH